MFGGHHLAPPSVTRSPSKEGTSQWNYSSTWVIFHPKDRPGTPSAPSSLGSLRPQWRWTIISRPCRRNCSTHHMSKADRFNNWKMKTMTASDQKIYSTIGENPLFAFSNSCLHLCEWGEDSDSWSSYAPHDPPHPGACCCHALPSKKQISLPSLCSTQLLGGFLVTRTWWCATHSHLIQVPFLMQTCYCTNYAVALHQRIYIKLYKIIDDDNPHEYVDIMIHMTQKAHCAPCSCFQRISTSRRFSLLPPRSAAATTWQVANPTARATWKQTSRVWNLGTHPGTFLKPLIGWDPIAFFCWQPEPYGSHKMSETIKIGTMVLSFHISREHIFNSKALLGQGDLFYFCELLLEHGKLMAYGKWSAWMRTFKVVNYIRLHLLKRNTHRRIFWVGPLLSGGSFSPRLRPPWPHHENDKSPGDACGPSVDGLRVAEKCIKLYQIMGGAISTIWSP